tara:strand:+ start:303 stop:1262 length:960 start_codon:yes stop_codon:yes gene_type:complete
MYNNLVNFLVNEKINFKENISVNNFSYIKTGGNAKYLIKPDTEIKYINLLIYLKTNKVNFFLIGKTTNILFDDKKEYECIVQTSLLNQFIFNNLEVEVQSGLSMPKLAHIMLNKNMTGFELMEGIPGSVGGGIFMNASTFDSAISDQLISVKYLNDANEIITKKKDALNFSFRKSIFHNISGYIISAKFKCKQGNHAAIFKKMRKYKKIRLEILEWKKPNLGSNFCTYDIYNEIGKNNLMYGILYKIYRVFRLYKLFSNKNLNTFTKIYFGWKNNFPYSDKTLNSFKKEVGTSSEDLSAYLDEINKITKNKLRQEIRII